MGLPTTAKKKRAMPLVLWQPRDMNLVRPGSWAMNDAD